MRWEVVKFLPEKLYGFCQGPDGDEVFFHAQDFHRVVPGGPLPILGEKVSVEVAATSQGRRPRANRVLRMQVPCSAEGTVKSFDSNRGWGFVDFGEVEPAFFHMSDRAIPWMPVIGSRIQFFVGYKSGRARVCWATPVRGPHE